MQLDAKCIVISRQPVHNYRNYIHRTQNAMIKKQIILPESLIGDDPKIDDYSR